MFSAPLRAPFASGYDISGAGDMVMSVLAMALAAGTDYDPAIRLANVAGGLEVEKIGVATVTREESPCEVYLSDYRPVDGRVLPHRIEVRHGNERYGLLNVASYSLK